MRRLMCVLTGVLMLNVAVWATPILAEDRTFDGMSNNTSFPTRGAANTPMIRFGYNSKFTTIQGDMIGDSVRANARVRRNASLSLTAWISSMTEKSTLPGISSWPIPSTL